MPRLEPWADGDTNASGSQDASAALYADCQRPAIDDAYTKPGATNQTYFDPKNDCAIYAEGKNLTDLLAEGYVDDFANQFAAYTKLIEKSTAKDPELLTRDRNDLVAGLTANPNSTDIHVTRDKDGNPTELFLNVASEIYVNNSFGLLDKFSTNPQLDPAVYDNPASTPEQATANATTYVNAQLAEMKKQVDADTSLDDAGRQERMNMYTADYVADFNRRRLENNYLPNFNAQIDESGNVEIVYQNPGEEGTSKK